MVVYNFQSVLSLSNIAFLKRLLQSNNVMVINGMNKVTLFEIGKNMKFNIYVVTMGTHHNNSLPNKKNLLPNNKTKLDETLDHLLFVL